MSRRPLVSACCAAPVVGMIDVTVHPRICVKDGRLVDGPLLDTMADVHRYVNRGAASDKSEAYCSSCGVTINPWALAVIEDPRPEWERK